MMPSKHDLSSELQKNKEHRLKLLNLNNKILQAKLDYLTILKQHYEDYWLGLDLECYEAKMDRLIMKAKFLTYQAIPGIARRVEQEMSTLEAELSEASLRLRKFKNLDPKLLAVYRSLKDEIECQEMLIKISEGNVSQGR